MRIERAGLTDAQAILDLQKLAYLQEAAIYDDYTIAPLHQTLAEMEEDLRQQVVLKAIHSAALSLGHCPSGQVRDTMVEERIVGSVRGTARGDTCFIGRLIVHPEVQDQRIGTRLLAEIEACFPLRSVLGCYAGVRRYELFTGHRSQKNLHLYDKLGYRPLRTQRLNDRLTLVYLEKTNAVHGCGDRT